jgi:ABC-type glycerol-3-phosphate transport system permease component
MAVTPLASEPAQEKRGRDWRWTKSRLRGWPWLIPMGLIAISTIYPIFFTINVALKTKKAFVMGRFSLVSEPTMQNFLRAWNTAKVGTYFWNSFIVTVGTVILLSIVASMAGYAFAQMRFKGNRGLFLVILAGMMIPIQVILVPFYQLILKTHLLNQHIGLILSYTAFFLPFSIYLMTAYYSGIPTDITEAAKVDGASLWGSYVHIILPLGKPALATLAILNTLYSWNDLLVSLLVMQDREVRTLMVGIAGLRGEFISDVPVIAAGLVLGALPVIILFLIFQRQISKGMTMGAVKG